MVQVLPEGEGNIFGRIGSSLGKSLAEQIPKEVDRYRLSKGIERLGEQSKTENLDPIQILSKLYGIPGITPEIANMVQQNIETGKYVRHNIPGKENQPNKEVKSIEESAISKKAPVDIKNIGFIPRNEIQKFKSELPRIPSNKEIQQKAAQLISQGFTKDISSAEKQAGLDLNAEREARKEKNIEFKQQFAPRIQSTLQNGGLKDYADISGKLLNSLQDQADVLINKYNLSPEEVADQLDELAFNLASTKDKINNVNSGKNFFRSTDTKAKDLRALKEVYDSVGAGEEFNELAASILGSTRLKAASMTEPLKNKKIKSEISSLKNQFKRIASDAFGSIFERTFKETYEKTFDPIIKALTPKDNIYTIEYELRKKGFNLQQFKDRVRELESEKEISLTEEQKRQLRQPVSESFYGDILLDTF